VSSIDISVAAGSLATAVFAVSTLPMMVKARRTRDVRSYSLGNIVLGNVGNVLYTVYVLHLPMGPIWALHAFHTLTTALMLYWYLRYVRHPRVERPGVPPRTVRPSAAPGTGNAAMPMHDRSSTCAGGHRPTPHPRSAVRDACLRP
jgi:hypothetical protein